MSGPVHEIQQREQEDPDDVNEVPVEADISTGVYHSGEKRLLCAIHAITLSNPKPMIMWVACRPVIRKYSEK